MKGNEPFGPRGPACFKGPPGPQPLMSIRPRMPSPNGFRQRFGPRIPFPRQGPRDFGPPRPRMNNPPAQRIMPPRPPRGLPRPLPPRALFPPNVPLMRQPIRPPINAPRNRRPPPLMATPTQPRSTTKRPKPSHSNSEYVPPPKRVPDADIDFTDDSFDIQSNKLGTAF